MILPRISAAEALALYLSTTLDDILPRAREIILDVRTRKDHALRAYAKEFGELSGEDSIIVGPELLNAALQQLSESERSLLERTANRIRQFAQAQLSTLAELTITIDGGRAGHTVRPVQCAACYAPGGRYPLPSSVLMTAVTARAAGVEIVWVASPKPSLHTLAAAAIAGADALLAAGGAHAVAALAYGTESVPASDIIVGPGNRWVTAAKQLVSATVKIDMLAGPSELAIVADKSANPEWVAADLLAQAEHDPDARVFLIGTDTAIVSEVELELEKQIEDLPTRLVASQSLDKSFAVVIADFSTIAELLNRLAPEHLSLQTSPATVAALRPLLQNYGGLFIGPGSAEVLGDYGLGPNHVLPTQGIGRTRGGLSVLDFLKIQTWMEVTDLSLETAKDIAALAQLEGLEAHRRSITRRNPLCAEAEVHFR